jgi:PilX N-terminal
MTIKSERGIALVLALFLTAALSVLASSLMFLAQTETYASMNYRMMSQARYGAEAGVQKAGNFLFDTTQYTKPSTAGVDLLTSYDYTGSPVKYNGQPVVLSAVTGVDSNYPVAAVVTAFQNAAKGSLAAGNQTIGYAAYAKLLSMQTFDPYGLPPGGSPGVVQTWEITSQGTLSGSRSAKVEVVALAEQPVWPANTYGAFATSATCGALYFHGNVTINSYDSTGLTGATAPTTTSSGGNVGTNGNLDIEGSVDVQGNLYTPRTGVGTCAANAVDALSETGSATVRGSMVQLPTTVTYPTPPTPSPMPPTSTVTVNNNTTVCADLVTAAATAGQVFNAAWCTTSGSGANQKVVIDSGGAPIMLPSLSIGSQVTFEIAAHASPTQVVNINSLDLTGGGQIGVKATNNNQAVIFNLAGKNPDGSNMATVMDFGGNSGGIFTNDTSACASCSQYDASMMQFIYAGAGNVTFRGNSAAAATVYAPNANVTFDGTADLYGSVLGKTVTNGGNANIHYDRRLSHDFYIEGMQMLGTFNWKRTS